MSPPRKKPRMINRLYISVLILFTFAVAVNGPIARTAITHFTNKGLESLGLSGYFFLNGTIVRGFTFNDINYSGKLAVQKLSIDTLALDYRLIREVIMEQKIRSVSVNQIHLIVDLSKLPEKEESEKSSPLDLGNLAETLNLTRGWVKPSEIQITQANIEINEQAEPQLHLQFDSLQHAPESDDIKLLGYQLSIRDEYQTTIQNSTLTWLENQFKLSHLEVLPKIGIDSLDLTLAPTFTAQGSLLFSDAKLAFQLLPERAQLEITEGSIQSSDIIPLLPDTMPVEASIQKLSVDLHSWLQHPSKWQLHTHIELPNIETQGYLLENTQVVVQKRENSITLDLSSTHQGAQLRSLNEITLSEPESPEWFESFKLVSDTHIANIAELASQYIPEELEIKTDDTDIYLKANATVNQLKPSQLEAELSLENISIAETPLPKIEAKVQVNAEQLADFQCIATLDSHPVLKTQGSFDIPTFQYKAQLEWGPKQLDWINTLVDNLDAPVNITKPITLSWDGSGVAKPDGPHLGTLELQAPDIEIEDPELSPITLATELEYEWPNKIQIKKLSIQDQKIQAEMTGLWDGESVQVSTKIADTGDETLATLDAELPLTLDHLTLKSYFQQNHSIDLQLKTQTLGIQQTLARLPQGTPESLKDLSGNILAELQFKGSLAAPQISGLVHLDDLRQQGSAFQSPVHLHLDFHSENDKLFIDSQVIDIKTSRVDAAFQFPFTPRKWLSSDKDLVELLTAEPLSGDLVIHQLPLRRLKELAPQIENIDGALEGNAKFTGSINDPQFTLDTKLRAPNIEISNQHIDGIKDLKLDCTILSDHTLTAELKALVNGSDTTLTASVDFKDLKDPSFKVHASTDHALLFRDDKVSIRANANIHLDGKLTDAVVSGNLDITESLFYQDIDILPIGVPSSAVANVDLPPVRVAELPLPIPEPFADWKLDFTLDFDDPLLIRGNIARGEVAGTVKATGTLASPKLDGEIATKGVVVKLPFSQLQIRKGRLVFDSSNRPLLPTLDIQGASLVNKYQTELFIYGSPLSPKITLTSQPPLPQSDIVTLMATGITPNDLKNNKEAATLRALQLFLAKFKQESENKTSAKIIATLLSSIQDFEFNVNETDTFTGRKFSSARMQLHPKVFITAQVDEEKNTRGLIVFVLKFR